VAKRKRKKKKSNPSSTTSGSKRRGAGPGKWYAGLATCRPISALVAGGGIAALGVGYFFWEIYLRGGLLVAVGAVCVYSGWLGRGRKAPSGRSEPS
jgi:hypothetical protein